MKLIYAAPLAILAGAKADFRLKRDTVVVDAVPNTAPALEDDNFGDNEGSGDPGTLPPVETFDSFSDFEDNFPGFTPDVYDTIYQDVTDVQSANQVFNEIVDDLWDDSLKNTDSDEYKNFVKNQQHRLVLAIRDQLGSNMWIPDDGVTITDVFEVNPADKSRVSRSTNVIGYTFNANIQYDASNVSAASVNQALTDSQNANSWNSSSAPVTTTPAPGTTPAPTGPGPIPHIPTCAGHTPQPDTEREITLSYIHETAKGLADDINNVGNSKFVNLFEKRIAGSMFLSRKTLDLGKLWLDHFDDLNHDAATAKVLADHMKASWTDAFVDCDDSDCVTQKFCESALLFTFWADKAGDTEVFDQLNSRCLNEAWRFNDYIMDQKFDHFDFSIVPMSSASCN
jgi:hypothetical protein